MKIKIQENALTNDELKSALEAQFPNYKINFGGAKLIQIAKTGTIGATALVRKNSIIINGNFPSISSRVVFMLCVILLGFLIPLIIYFAAFHGKMKSVEKEVVAFIKEKYADKLLK